MTTRRAATVALLAISCAAPRPATLPGPKRHVATPCEASSELRAEAQRLFDEGRLYRSARALDRADAICASGAEAGGALRRRVVADLSGEGDAQALFREGLEARRGGDAVGTRRAFDRAMAALAREAGELVWSEARSALWKESGPFPPIVWSKDGACYYERSTGTVVDAVTGIGHLPPARIAVGDVEVGPASDGSARFTIDADTWTVELPPPASHVRLVRSERPALDYLPQVLDPSGKLLWVDGVTVEVASGRVLADRGVEAPLAPQLDIGSGELWTLAFPTLQSWQWERERSGHGIPIPIDAGRLTFNRRGAPVFVEPISGHTLPPDAPVYGADASRRVFRPLSRSTSEILPLDRGRVALRDAGDFIRVGSSDRSAPALRFSVPDSLGFAASPDGMWIATTDIEPASGVARIWDSRTVAPVAELREGAPFVDVAFSPNGAWMVTLTTSGALYVWNVSNHFAKARSLNASSHEELRRRGLAFSADGRLLATRSGRGYRIWDFTRGAEIANVEAPISSKVVGFSLDGGTLWTDDGDHLTARSIDGSKPTWSVFATPDGRAIVGLSSEGRARVLGDVAAARRAMSCRAGRWVYPFELCEDALSGP